MVVFSKGRRRTPCSQPASKWRFQNVLSKIRGTSSAIASTAVLPRTPGSSRGWRLSPVGGHNSFLVHQITLPTMSSSRLKLSTLIAKLSQTTCQELPFQFTSGLELNRLERCPMAPLFDITKPHVTAAFCIQRCLAIQMFRHQTSFLDLLATPKTWKQTAGEKKLDKNVVCCCLPTIPSSFFIFFLPLSFVLVVSQPRLLSTGVLICFQAELSVFGVKKKRAPLLSFRRRLYGDLPSHLVVNL